MKIEKDKVVAFHYTLKDKDGNQLDSSVGAEPLEYYHGHGFIIAGLERELEGKEKGQKFSCKIEARDAYGIYEERLVASIPRDRFDTDQEIQIGMTFQVDTPAGPTFVRVIEVEKDFIKVDANHELAGKDLFFDIEVTEVREPSEEEKNQFENFTNGCGGCGGGCGGCGNEDCGGCGGTGECPEGKCKDK